MAEETKEKPAPAEKRDWVGEAVQCFIKDATDIDPTDPVKAVAAYFKAQAAHYGSEDYSGFYAYYGAPFVRQTVMQNQALDLLVEKMIKG